MKKKIFLGLILLVEIILLVSASVYQSHQSLTFLKPIFQVVSSFVDVIVLPVSKLLKLSDKPYGGILTLAILNVVFIIVYYLIFGTITVLIRKSKRKKVARVVKSHYVLSPIEEERYSYHNYMKKFPKARVFSLIIPLAFFAIFVLTAFDKGFCESFNISSLFPLDIYSKHIGPVISDLFGNDNLLRFLFSNNAGFGYFDLIIKIPDKLFWLEFVILFVLLFALLGVWYGLLTILYLPFRKVIAKRKAKKARDNYIFKQDYKEYKLRTKYSKKYSYKSDEFMSALEESDEEQHLAKVDKPTLSSKKDLKPADYYDDLGHGVKSLGVGENQEEKKERAIIEREIRYISDKDFDIELESEPVIEVVEEDSLGQLRHAKEDELYYEKYQPDDVDIKSFEEYSKDQQNVHDYVSNINLEETKEIENEDLVDSSNEVGEESLIEKYEETPNFEQIPVVEEQEEVKENLVEENVEEEIVQPVIEEVESNNEEDEIQEISLESMSALDKYRLEKKEERAKLEKERQALIEAGTLTEENDPLRKYRKSGARSGKYEARVPTIKEQEILKQASIIEKKQKKHK